MYQRLVFCLFLIVGFTVNGEETQEINIIGNVVNQANVAIDSVIVELVGLGLKDTTDAEGLYTLSNATRTVRQKLLPKTEKIVLNRGVLELSLPNSSPVKVEIFDINGKLLKRELKQNAEAGIHRMNVAEAFRTTKLLVIHASTGRSKMTFRYLPMNSGRYTVNFAERSVPLSGKLAKIMEVKDTLKVTAANYLEQKIPTTSYDTTINITLDTLDDNAITVRLDQERLTFQGFGINACLMEGSIFPLNECFTLEVSDALGMSILRIGMTTAGGFRGVPNGWQQARDQYGAKIIGSCWSEPAGWKDNVSEDGGGHLYSSHYAEWATRIADFARTNNLYAMSIANEADFASCTTPPCTNHYASMVYTAKEMVEFVKVAGPIFKEKAPGVKLIAPEASLWIHVWSSLSPTAEHLGLYKSTDPLDCNCFSNDINDAAALEDCEQKCFEGDGYDYGHWLAKDTAAWNAVDILGVHEYESQVAYPWPSDVTDGVRTKEVWQTEMSGVMYWPEQGPSVHIENGVAVARWIQSALTIGEASAWLYWWNGAPYYQSDDNEGLALIKGSSQKAKRYYTYGNYSRYIRPGHKIVNITGIDNLPEKVLLTASKSDDGKVVIVAVNETTSTQSISIKISGGTVPSSLTPVVTNATENWAKKSAVPVTGGVLNADLEKMSVTTFITE